MSQELIDKLSRFEAESRSHLTRAGELDQLAELKTQILGKKGELSQILKSLGGLSPDARKSIGEAANQVKLRLETVWAERESTLKRARIQKQLESETIDVTLGGLEPRTGSLHPVTLVLEQCKSIFRGLGFDIGEGPEIETDFYNFEALNIPQNHPARDMQDTFYFEDGRLLRTHTSPVQIRVMQKQKPPIAMVAPGPVYRCDSDVTHTPMFHQLEALLVDQHIHFGHLKAVIHEFLKKLFEVNLDLRFRPSFFPFTEPSAEVDMSCVFCGGKGCRICKHTGWIEIMGCGMVDPEVFRHVGIDSQKYSGFAFGLGIERVAMLKFGINDLRLFFENDVRFLKQF